MNPKIKKVIDEIERTKAKIAELQTLLPELERKRIDMENTEIIKLIRSADILPEELSGFLESLKTPKEPVSLPLPQHETGASRSVADDAVEEDDGGHDDDEYPDDGEDYFNTKPKPED